MPEQEKTPNLDYLKEQVRVLSQLLNDPQPGLFSWVQMYGETMQKIVNFWNDK